MKTPKFLKTPEVIKENAETIMYILAIGFVILTAFTFYVLRSNKNKVDFLTIEKEFIKKELDKKILALDNAMSTNERMNNELNKAKDRLIVLRDSVSDLKNMTKGTVRALYRRVDELERLNRILIQEADSLRISNRLLSVANDSAHLDIERKKILLEKKDVENNLLSDKNKTLVEKVTKAAVLTIGNIEVFAMKEKNSGALRQTNVARRVNVIRTNFLIRENPIAASGVKKAYIIIENASGKIVAPRGNFNDENGKMVEYSDISDVEYSNQDLEVIIITNIPEKSLTKGQYRIKVYLENRLVGVKDVALK